MKTVTIQHELPAWSDWYADRLASEFAGHRFRAAHSPDEAMAMAPETEVFIGIGPKMTPALVAAMPRLEWVQSLTTGIDNLLQMETFPRHVPISRCTGVQGPQMSELALMFMLALARRLPETLAAQSRSSWERRPQPLLHGKTVCLLGLGSIAEMLALYCRTLGMTVTAVSQRREASNVERIFSREALHSAVAEADFLVVLTPLTPQTRHIVGREVLRAMKSTAFVINIARGGCVDEAALIEALEQGTIAGAGFDVFETEPLPAGDPMWSAPNVILTPHIGGFADVYHEQCFPTVRENFRRYLEGGPGALTDAARRS